MGLVWGGGSLLRIRAEGVSLPLTLFVVGGLGMTVSHGYKLYSIDPKE